MNDRKAFGSLCTCCARVFSGMAQQYELGASLIMHDHFQEWEQAGFFHALWQAAEGVTTKTSFDTMAGRSI